MNEKDKIDPMLLTPAQTLLDSEPVPVFLIYWYGLSGPEYKIFSTTYAAGEFVENLKENQETVRVFKLLDDDLSRIMASYRKKKHKKVK
jgi:hypothetical protein